MLRARTLPAKVSASIASGVYCPQSGRSASLHASKSNSGVLRRSSLGRIIASIERYFGQKSLWRDFAAQKGELQTQRSNNWGRRSELLPCGGTHSPRQRFHSTLHH